MAAGLVAFSLLLLLCSGSFFNVESTTLEIKNMCRHSVWPGIHTGVSGPTIYPTGFKLKDGESKKISVPENWTGQIWGRTLCSTDSTTGKFSCVTGDCGTGEVECKGSQATQPATRAEFGLNMNMGRDYYIVSVFDGFNIPMLVVAKYGKDGGCSSTGCLVDLNQVCPLTLSVTRGKDFVACKGACLAFNDPVYCCNGEYGMPGTCQPTKYSLFFKYACPRAYTYRDDEHTSSFACADAEYLILFCPPPYSSNKVLTARKQAAQLPLINQSMLYVGGRGHPDDL